MPPSNWPITAGCPMRCIASPSRRPNTSINNICTTNSATEWPEPGAGPAAASTTPLLAPATATRLVHINRCRLLRVTTSGIRILNFIIHEGNVFFGPLANRTFLNVTPRQRNLKK